MAARRTSKRFSIWLGLMTCRMCNGSPKPFTVCEADVAVFEQGPGQPMRLGRDENCIGLGERLG